MPGASSLSVRSSREPRRLAELRAEWSAGEPRSTVVRAHAAPLGPLERSDGVRRGLAARALEAART